MKSIELIVSDLDGTLLHGNDFANENDVEILKGIQCQDMNVVLATGRSWFLSHEYATKLLIDKHTNLLVCNNGAIVTKADHFEPLFCEAVEVDDLAAFVAIANEMHLCLYAFKADAYAAYWNGIECPSQNLQDNGWTKSFETIALKNNNFLQDKITQIMVFVLPEHEKDFLARTFELRKNVSGQKSDLEDVPFYEFNRNGVSKGNALKKVAEYLGVSLENTIVFGDNYNDISMFEVAGISVAMGNANDNVKAKANHVTENNLDGGVSTFINQYILNQDEV